MLIKVSDELRAAAFNIPSQAIPVKEGDLAPRHVVSAIPEWMFPLIMESSLIVIDDDDWLSIPCELLPYVKILHR